MEQGIWRHCSLRYTQLDPSHHPSSLSSLQQHSFAPNSCSKPQPRWCPSPTICLAALQPAIPAPPFGPQPLPYLSGSLSLSKFFFFQHEFIQLCFPFFYPLVTIAGAEPRLPPLLLLSVAFFHLGCSTPLKHISWNNLCHSNLPAREPLCGTLKRGTNELKLRMRLICGAEEGRHSQE